MFESCQILEAPEEDLAETAMQTQLLEAAEANPQTPFLYLEVE